MNFLPFVHLFHPWWQKYKEKKEFERKKREEQAMVRKALEDLKEKFDKRRDEF